MIFVSGPLKYSILTARKTPAPNIPKPAPPPKIEAPAKIHGRPAINQQRQNPIWMMALGLGD